MNGRKFWDIISKRLDEKAELLYDGNFRREIVSLSEYEFEKLTKEETK
jgi:hypothetical protein